MKIGNCIRALVWVALIACMAICGLLADKAYGLSCPGLPCRLAGFALLLVVLRASAVTGRYLAVYGKSSPGKGFGEVDRLVDKGPYSCMRHPMHFFLSLFPLSIALLLASPGAVVIALVEAALILVMARVLDEKESIERFGEKYLEYRRRVPAFNPSPRCLYLALARRPPKPRASREE